VTSPRSTGPFRRGTLALVIATGTVSVLVALALRILPSEASDEPSPLVHGYSRSAIGYQAWIEILEEVGVPVSRARARPAARARDGLLVIVAPPAADPLDRERLQDMVGEAARVLVVLPRWSGVADPEQPAWIASRHQRATAAATAVLDALDLDATLERRATRLLAAADWGGAPELDEAQLLVDHDLDVEIEALDGEGALLASTWYDEDTRLFVLADPSSIDNAGLRRRGNLHFAVGLIEELRRGGPVVFDETLHGFVTDPSLTRQLLEMPLVLVSLQLAVCTILLFWAAVRRFGPARAAPPPVRSGKDFLIRNTAALLHVGGHEAEAVERYLATTIQRVRAALHAPPELSPATLRTWLERIRTARGGTIPLSELENEVAELARAGRRRATSRRIALLAARIHRWRTEMTHGPHHPS
jgi:hypothetical protein